MDYDINFSQKNLQNVMCKKYPFHTINFRQSIRYKLAVNRVLLQVTFSEKGTKITHKIDIRKFEILEISLWN